MLAWDNRDFSNGNKLETQAPNVWSDLSSAGECGLLLCLVRCLSARKCQICTSVAVECLHDVKWCFWSLWADWMNNLAAGGGLSSPPSSSRCSCRTSPPSRSGLHLVKMVSFCYFPSCVLAFLLLQFFSGILILSTETFSSHHDVTHSSSMKPHL